MDVIDDQRSDLGHDDLYQNPREECRGLLGQLPNRTPYFPIGSTNHHARCLSHLVLLHLMLLLAEAYTNLYEGQRGVNYVSSDIIYTFFSWLVLSDITVLVDWA